jgi:hypothetical protein
MQYVLSPHCLTNHMDQSFLDANLSVFAPYIKEIDDDLPIFDIMIGRGSKPGWYRGSVAIFLPDNTVQAAAEDRSADIAIQRAFSYLAKKITFQEQAKKLLQAKIRDSKGLTSTLGKTTSKSKVHH